MPNFAHLTSTTTELED